MITKQEYLDIYDVIGAAMEVHKTLGRGMAEALYQEALEMEMTANGLSCEREKMLLCYYKGIIVELKAVEKIGPEHRAQLINYMRISGQDKGLLINFGEISLRTERYIYNEDDDNYILLTKDNYKDYIIDEK